MAFVRVVPITKLPIVALEDEDSRLLWLRLTAFAIPEMVSPSPRPIDCRGEVRLLLSSLQVAKKRNSM